MPSPPAPDLHLLARLVAVADQGSLQAAARSLRLTPAALTKSIQQLEAGLGVSLLDRSTRPARLTSAGVRTVERARHLLGMLEELPREVAPPADTLEGRVRLALGPLVADALLASIAAQAQRLAPRLAIAAELGHWVQCLDLLKLGRCDLFLGDVTTAAADPAFVVRPFPSVPIVMFCRAGHPILRERSASPAAVLGYPLVGNTPPPWGVRWLQDLYRRARRQVPHPDALLHISCDSVPTLRALVAGSDMLGFSAPLGIEADVHAGRLAIVPFDMGGLRSNAGSVIVAGRAHSPATLLLREAAHAVAERGAVAASGRP